METGNLAEICTRIHICKMYLKILNLVNRALLYRMKRYIVILVLSA